MIEVTQEQSATPPDTNWAQTVCKIGQGAACCRYLCMGPKGWCCEKHTELAVKIDARTDMNAKSDNCPGRASA